MPIHPTAGSAPNLDRTGHPIIPKIGASCASFQSLRPAAVLPPSARRCASAPLPRLSTRLNLNRSAIGTRSAISTVDNKHTGFSEGPHFTLNSKDPRISERFQTLKSLTKTPPRIRSSNTISETSVSRTDRQIDEWNCTVIF